MGGLGKHVWARAGRARFEDVRGRWMKQRKRDRGTGESHEGIKKPPIKLSTLKGPTGTWQLHAKS